MNDVNNMAGYDPNVIAASHSPVDARSRVDESPNEAVARITKEAQLLRDEIVALGGKVDGMPEISGIDPSDLARVRDVYAQKKAEVKDKASMETLENGMRIALGGTGAQVLFASADKGMLPAANGVFSPEEIAQKNNASPINKELEQILAKAGAGKEPLMLAGLASDPQHVDRENLSQLVPNQNLPNRSVELAQEQQKSGGRQIERTV